MIRLCLALLFAGAAAAAEPGPLVIVGGGKLPAAVRAEFVTLAGGQDARIVVIPTASAAADDPKERDSYLKPWRDAGAKEVAYLHTRDRKTADTAEFVKPLAEATAVWFAGGDQSKLTEAYRGTLAETELKKRHAAGLVVGGTSAGAAVMSDPMITGGSETATTGPGLGFLPGVIVDQHFTQRKRAGRLTGLAASHPKLLAVGIDESTAFVVKGTSATVVGDGAATVFDFATATPSAGVVLKAGDKYDLAKRAKE